MGQEAPKIAPAPANASQTPENPARAVLRVANNPGAKPKEIKPTKGRPGRPTNVERAARLASSALAISPEGYSTMRKLARGLDKELPTAEKVALYAKIARGKLEPADGNVQLKALERIDALQGVVTAEVRARMLGRQAEVASPPSTPIFMLPPGSNVRIGIEIATGCQTDITQPEIGAGQALAVVQDAEIVTK